MLTTEELDALRAKHGDIVHACGKAGSWEIVFKKPARKDYKVFRSRIHNPAQKSDAQENLLRTCVVHPALDTFEAMLERYPGIAESDAVTNGIAELTGVASEEDGK